MPSAEPSRSVELSPRRPVTRGGRARRACSVAAMLVFTLPGWLLLHAQKSKFTDYDVKAAYLFNFGKFIAWPENAASDKNAPFTICVLGRDPFGATLDTAVMGQSIGGKKAVARRISKPEEAAACRELFISDSEADRLSSDITALDHLGILTVSDMDQFSERGGMIQFVSYENHVRFEVNLTNTTNANLMLSADLLKVATTVRRNQQGGF